jgi:peptidylprolyl isomerase
MKACVLIISLCVALAIAGCGDDGDSSTTSGSTGASAADAAKRSKPKLDVPKGAPPTNLEVKDLIEGGGPAAASGDVITVQYVGVDYETGKQFDASWDNGQPFSFQLGGGQVIPGWDRGIDGMRVGGRRELIIPPDLAYGRIGQPPAIGPNATLVFVIDLLGIQ